MRTKKELTTDELVRMNQEAKRKEVEGWTPWTVTPARFYGVNKEKNRILDRVVEANLRLVPQMVDVLQRIYEAGDRNVDEIDELIRDVLDQVEGEEADDQPCWGTWLSQ